MRDFSINPDGWWTGQDYDMGRLNTDRVDQWEITPRELQRRIERGDDLILVDVREPWEAEIASLPGSRLIPLGELDYRADEELDRDREIVLYCHHGIRSMEAAVALWSIGFERVKNLSGGIARWAAQLDPDMRRY